MDSDSTFSIIKPDAVSKGHTGQILARITDAGFTITALRMVRLTRQQAEDFYYVHRERGFYRGLVEFMSSGPVIVMVLRKANAVEEFRKLIGSTDPASADQGTIRADFATDVQKNAVHGSDSPENAGREASFFFAAIEIF
ncbi:MAG: nucleoside-diphosphate kinase [Bacteroidales bacterium]|nr:nucleoside-diphosphate kinase [Bacteroidales bacterium]MDT8374939.1 nucleoside-diphosphate kinase [Bacteroidales bacterium]